MNFKVEFIEPLLGSMSGNKDITREFIISKHPNPENVDEDKALENIDDDIEKSSTIFARDDDGTPILWDYHLKGFFKAAQKALILSGEHTQEELKKVNLTNYTHKRTIDLLVFAKPRKIRLILPEGGIITQCQRPLRGETMRGERIALANSEQLPAGTTFTFEVEFLNSNLKDYIIEWMNYGQFSGLGQWRNSGKGRFKFTQLS